MRPYFKRIRYNRMQNEKGTPFRAEVIVEGSIGIIESSNQDTKIYLVYFENKKDDTGEFALCTFNELKSQISKISWYDRVIMNINLMDVNKYLYNPFYFIG